MAIYQGLTRSAPDVKVGVKPVVPRPGVVNLFPGSVGGGRVAKVSYGYSLSTKEVEKVPISKPRTLPLEWKAVVPTH